MSSIEATMINADVLSSSSDSLRVAMGSFWETESPNPLSTYYNFNEIQTNNLTNSFYLSAFYLLTFVVNKLPIAIVYATWSGLGIFTIAIFGYIFFKQTLAWQAILGLFLIVIGVILVNSFTIKLN